LPLDGAELAAALGRLKLDRLIAGYRGAAPGDRRALLDMVTAIADYAGRERSRLLELDVNPIVVLPEGQGVVAVDALIRFSANASD
jgi:acetyl-CoA synthetase